MAGTEHHIENGTKQGCKPQDVHPEILLAMNTANARTQPDSLTCNLPVVFFTESNSRAGAGQVLSSNAETVQPEIRRHAAPERHIEKGADKQADKSPKDAPVPKEVQKFATEHGMTAKLVDGNYEFHLKANGEDKVICSVDSHLPLKDGLREADAEIARRVHEKEAALHNRYGVDFSSNGETTVVEGTDGKQRVNCREPNLKELAAIEAALKKNNHKAGGADQGAPKFYFLKNEVNGFESSYAITNTDSSGRNAIFIHPSFDWMKATDADGGYRDRTMETAIAHELSHVDRMRDLGLKAPMSEPTPEELARYKRMGWSEIPLANGDKIWAIQGKHGEYYALAATVEGVAWIRVNEHGEPLHSDGTPVKQSEFGNSEDVDKMLKNGSLLLDDDIVKRAKVRPPTNYMPNPEDVLCEAESLFHDGDKRAWLLRLSPKIYEEAKAVDQQRINRENGTAPDGQPLYIRSPNGEIVPNTEENRAIVAKFEADARHGA